MLYQREATTEKSLWVFGKSHYPQRYVGSIGFTNSHLNCDNGECMNGGQIHETNCDLKQNKTKKSFGGGTSHRKITALIIKCSLHSHGKNHKGFVTETM